MQSESISYWASILVLLIILAVFFLIQNVHIMNLIKKRNETVKGQNEEDAPKKDKKESGGSSKEWQNPQVVMLEKERSARMQNLIDRLYNGENKKTKRSKKE